MLDNKIAHASEFERFINNLIEKNSNFKAVRSEPLLANRYRPDIITLRKVKDDWETLIIEIKIISSYTGDRLKHVVDQLKSYQSVMPASKLAFVFPGVMSQPYKHLLEENDVEVQDIQYITKNFAQEVQQSEDLFPFFAKVYKDENSESIADAICTNLIRELKSISAGRQNWGEYQKLIKKILDFLFTEKLSSPIEESSDFTKTNRRDFILRNYAENGFWALIRHRYLADFIVVDAKNYSKKVTKKEVLQISNYLKAHGTGLFGLIISRNGGDKGCDYTCREIWAIHSKLVIILDDNDIENMLLAKKSGSSTEEIIQQKIEKFRLSI